MFRFTFTLLVLAATFCSGFALSCFYRELMEYDAINGSSVVCPSSRAFQCFSISQTDYNYRYADCGNYPTTDLNDLYICNTDNCNSATPSAISCFRRYAATNYTVNGTSQICHTGITTCYGYVLNLAYYGGCGVCMASQPSNCRICNTSYCNTVPQPKISCHKRLGTNFNSTDNGESVACHPETYSCYSFNNGTSHFANCGTCTSAQASLYNCTSCNTTNCNALSRGAEVSTISCYNRTGSVSSSNGTITACNPGIFSCHSYAEGSSQYAGCGNCTSVQAASYGCTSCNTTNCNSALISTISCYYRIGSASSCNGTITACNPGISSCHSYYDGSSSYAGCGSCTALQICKFGCSSCNTSSCNYKKILWNDVPVFAASIKTTVVGVLLLELVKFF